MSRLYPNLRLYAVYLIEPDGSEKLAHPAMHEAEARVYMSWHPGQNLVAREIVCYLKTGGKQLTQPAFAKGGAA